GVAVHGRVGERDVRWGSGHVVQLDPTAVSLVAAVATRGVAVDGAAGDRHGGSRCLVDVEAAAFARSAAERLGVVAVELRVGEAQRAVAGVGDPAAITS